MIWRKHCGRCGNSTSLAHETGLWNENAVKKHGLTSNYSEYLMDAQGNASAAARTLATPQLPTAATS
jgi:hypothetical protein